MCVRKSALFKNLFGKDVVFPLIIAEDILCFLMVAFLNFKRFIDAMYFILSKLNIWKPVKTS